MNFRKLNILVGWITFLVAAVTYLATIEPTASFWDCGEFIATAYKLEVGHPPGAPLFMILARVFSAFIPVEQVPAAINVISALASAFTILFLFWSITHLARKLATRNGSELTSGKLIAVMGSGIAGALAYTWSDSFWFSAVEGEVYALSSLFTAVVFWAILKWESEAEEAHNTRWLILIAYMVGLSIGVHLLNLLCIPAIAFVYYFKKFKVTPKGVAMTFVISALILGAIQAVIIPGVVKVAGGFEKFFVNSMGLPFNTGNLVYALILLGLLVAGIIHTQRKGKVIQNLALLSVTMILIGYSTFAMIVIRSSANPPIDENNPENVFNLLSYLNREQYGDRPLLSGQFWDSPYLSQRIDGKPVYTASWQVQKDGRTVKTFYDGWSAEHYMEQNPGHTVRHEYVVTDDKKETEVVYAPEFTMMFPRMYSPQANHAAAYKEWSEFEGRPISWTEPGGKRTIINKPTFGENMTFFFNYQMGWMYWRYFLWNFSGRQNDIQGHGNILDGNWLTGLDFIDEQRLGEQEYLPTSMTRNRGYNRLYLLPLILGLIGLVFHMFRHTKDFSVVALLFFFTGIAVVIYLNQYPYQPRERDYAYVGSFYAFAIWIGLGVYALFAAANSITQKDLGKAIGVAAGIGVLKYLIEMAQGADHATSYAILFIAVVSAALLQLFALLGKSTKDERPPALLASLVGLAIPLLMLSEMYDDHDRSKRETARDMASDYLQSCAPNAVLFTNGDNDTFPLWYAQEVEGIRTDVRVVNLSLLNTDWYIDQMRRKAYESDPVPFQMDPAKYRQGTRDLLALIPSQNPNGVYVELKNAIEFATNDKNMQVLFNPKKKDAYIPSNRFKITVDKEQVFKTGTLPVKDTANVVDEIKWEIKKSVLLKNHFLLLDLLANNNWERPIYFAVTTGPDSYINLQNYFQLEGLTYRFVPVYTDNKNPNLYGRVQTDTMHRNVTERYRWGNMDADDVYLDENVLRMATNLRLQLSNLAEALIDEGKDEMAKEILDISITKMPDRNVPFDRILLPTIEAYYELGEFETANDLNELLFTMQEENMNYFMSLEPRFADQVMQEMRITHAVMQRLSLTADAIHKQGEFGKQLQDRFKTIDQAFQLKQQEMQESQGRKTIRGRF